MSQRRASGPCPHGSAGTRPYPVWPGDGWKRGENAELDAALGELEKALTACAPVLPELARGLTSQDVQRALRALPIEFRPSVLKPLGLSLKPRQVTQGLCQDVRGRLARADDHALHHSLDGLAYGIGPDLRLFVMREEFDEEVVEQFRDPVEHWGTRLVLTSIWAGCLSTVKDARLWAWAARQSWFAPSSVTPEQVAAVLEAAERVIELSPDFKYRAVIEGDDGLDDEQHEHATATNDGAASAGEQAGSGASAALLDALAAFERSVSDAVPAAERITADLREGRAPQPDDVDALVTARSTFDVAAAAADAAGHPASAETVAALRDVAEFVSVAAHDDDARAQLARALTLTAPDESPLLTALAAAQQQARELLATVPWSDAERGQAHVLGSLVALASTTLNASARLELITAVTTASPALALLAVQAEQLILSPEPVTHQAPAPEAAHVVPAVVAAPAPEPAVLEQASEPTGVAEELAVEEPVAEEPDVEVEETPEPDLLAVEITATTPELAEESADQVEDAEDTGDGHAEAAHGLADLIADSRFDLAAAVAKAEDAPAAQQAALRIAALSRAVRHQNGPVAAALRGEFDDPSADRVAADTASLLLTVPALVRTALITGEPAVGVLLTELAHRVEPNLSVIADEVGQRTLKGVLVDAQAIRVVADVSEAERGLQAIITAAQHVRTRPRTLRFKRATDISKILLGATGVLGKPLMIVERNDAAEVETVVTELARLNDSTFVRSSIDGLDRRFQGASGRPIEGAGRQDLHALFTEAMRPMADWVDNVRARNGEASRSQHWSTGEVAALRTVVFDRRSAALAALDEMRGHTDELVAAAAAAAHTSLADTLAILDGSATLPVSEPTPQQALTLELLRVTNARVDSDLGEITAPDGTTAAALLEAAQRSWDVVVHAQTAAERFDVAAYIFEMSRVGILPRCTVDGDGLTVVEADVFTAEAPVRQELVTAHEQLTATLRRARLNNEISDEQDGELAGLLADAETNLRGHNLASVRSILTRAEELLPEYRAEAKSRLTDRLDVLRADQRVDEPTLERLTKLMDDGQLSTAEELIYFLEIDEDVPDVHESEDLQRFFPAVPEALRRGITHDVIRAVKDRGQIPDCPVLDFSDLSPGLAALAADALNAWRQLGGYEPENRTRINETEMIAPALQLIGIEAQRHKRLDDLPRNQDRRFVEFSFGEILGKALVPAFGSKLGKRLRVLLAWGQPSADLLISWADGDKSGESLLVAHFGTMSAATRRDLAAKASRRPAPMVVLDDAALTYLAAHGNRQMTATMNVLLPFSVVNPYLRQKRGVVAPEMFYGRDAERRSVLDPDGTQLVFGGRGLGKSALLNSAAEQFERQASVGERVAVYLDLKAVGIRADSAINQEAIWDALLDALTRRELFTVSTRSGRQGNPREQVQAGVETWLGEDLRRRLLILLDESDQFFEADMPHFMETTRLKSLGQQNHNRVKVVFAGLHSVQRYAKTSRNAPFGHMAQRPTVIGPLRPQHATNLLTRPMSALGHAFDDPDLVNRVLGFCSYQPFLLQIFANRLIELLQTTRSSDGLTDTQPPYVVTREHVEAVETHADLRADIRTAFHETLNLDHRYGLIAHVLAQHANESGLDARMTDTQLREECLAYWPDGFAKLDVEGFRAYLQEMIGLGVLAPNNDGRGWHLRSANVLSMIGSRDDVEAQLVSAAELSVPDEFLALESRLPMASGRRSPLTASQLDDVLGDHGNQVRLIVGSAATGIDQVTAAVQEAANVGNRFTVSTATTGRMLKNELVAGQPGQRRVVLDDLHAKSLGEDACTVAVELARTLRPSASGVTRSAVVVAGPAQMPVWREVFAALADGTAGGVGGMLPVSTVTLRRYDAASLRVWSLETNTFASEERREQLLKVTGGWPHLVEKAAALVKAEGGLDEHAALDVISKELASPAGVAALVEAVGLATDASLCSAFEGVLSMIDSGALSRSDLQLAVEMMSPDPTAVECLLALQLFDVDASGRFVVEPCLLMAWPHRR
jgi:hypothetical protein